MSKVILTIATLLAVVIQEEDVIIWKDETREKTRCMVIKETCKEIVYLKTGIQRKEPIDKVLEVRYYNTLPSYNDARELFEKERYENAIGKLEEIIKDDKNKDKWFYQYSLYMVAESHRKLGRYKEAKEIYEKLRRDVADTKFLKDLHIKRYECSVLLGDTKGVEISLKDWQDDVKKFGLEGSDTILAIYKAEFAEGQGDFQPAYEMYLKLTKNEDKGIRERGILGELRTLSKLKRYNELETRCKEYIKSEDSHKILTASYNGLGDIFLEKKMFKDAIKAYLRGVLQYTVPETAEYEYALFGAAISMLRYAKESPEKKDTYKERAKKLYSQLSVMYPSSKYLKPLKEEIEGTK
jgi:tetratricopeptide (TPR) repeat protein